MARFGDLYRVSVLFFNVAIFALVNFRFIVVRLHRVYATDYF